MNANLRILQTGILFFLCCGTISCVVIARTHKVRESERPKPARSATREELIQRINSRLEATHSFQAKVRFDLRSGSIASGEWKDYHEIKGFILYRQPDHIRMIGQIPTFGVNALDMVSDGREFRVSFAPYKKFIIGSSLDRPSSKKPLENLRPAHILAILAISPIAPESDRHVVFLEEASEGRENYYVLGEAERDEMLHTRIVRKLWVDRVDLTLARQQLFSENGMLESDARYADYMPSDEPLQPKRVDLWRPREDYGLKIFFDEFKLNLPLDDTKFELTQPQGYDVLEVGKIKKNP